VKVVVSAGALDDMKRLFEFLAAKDVRSGQRAIDAVEHAIQSISELPRRGRPSGMSGVRELIIPFGRAAYILRYAQDSGRDEIVILRLWHSREERL